MAKKVNQNDLRQMMAKMKTEKANSAANNKLKKYKLSSRELALIDEEKKRKAEEQNEEKRKFAKKAGVPENFFDSAKTKAFLNLNKAPQKSILKKKSSSGAGASVPGANSKATGHEWTSSAPVLANTRTPAGGSIKHLQEEQSLPGDFFDNKQNGVKVRTRPPDVPVPGPNPKPESSESTTSEPAQEEDKGDLPEGFFDDPIQDAKARGIEYKDPAEEEWEAFKKEISAEVAAADEAQAEGELQDTTERQLAEIDEQMHAWSRVREAELKKDEVEEKLKVAKEELKKKREAGDDSDLDEDEELEMNEFLDWRNKKS